MHAIRTCRLSGRGSVGAGVGGHSSPFISGRQWCRMRLACYPTQQLQLLADMPWDHKSLPSIFPFVHCRLPWGTAVCVAGPAPLPASGWTAWRVPRRHYRSAYGGLVARLLHDLLPCTCETCGVREVVNTLSWQRSDGYTCVMHFYLPRVCLCCASFLAIDCSNRLQSFGN